MQDWNCSVELDYTAAVTIRTIRLHNSPTLSAIARYDNKLKAVYCCIIHITAAVDYFNVAGNMNARQIEEAATLLYGAYRTLTIDDIVLCFNRAKMGNYGKIFDRLDGSIILDWFRQYQAERNDEIEAAVIREHQQRKEAEKRPDAWTPEGRAEFKIVLERLKVSEVVTKIRVKRAKKKKLLKRLQDKAAFTAHRLSEQQKICTLDEIAAIKDRPVIYE